MRPQRDYPMLFWEGHWGGSSTTQGRSRGSNVAKTLVQMCGCKCLPLPPLLSRGLYCRLNAGAAAHRALLGGPADALIKASRPHHASKEASGPSKAVGIEPEQNPVPVPVPDQPQLVQPASSAAGAAVAAAQPGPNEASDKAKNNATNTAIKSTKPLNSKAARVHRHSTKTRGPKPAAATAASTAAATIAPTQPAAAAAATQQRTLLGGPSDIFNKATRAHHATKEASGPSKTTGVNNPPQPQQQPSTKPLAVSEPGLCSLLQFGWSGSSASASASASAGSGGWGGDSWAGAQGECTEESTDCCMQHALEGETGCLHALASWLLSSPECS